MIFRSESFYLYFQHKTKNIIKIKLGLNFLNLFIDAIGKLYIYIYFFRLSTYDS